MEDAQGESVTSAAAGFNIEDSEIYMVIEDQEGAAARLPKKFRASKNLPKNLFFLLILGRNSGKMISMSTYVDI